MEMNISPEYEQPFNGIRFSVEGQNKKVEPKVVKSIFEAYGKMPDFESHSALNQAAIDAGKKQAYD